MAGKVKYHHLRDDEKKVYLGDFYTMVSMLESRDEVKNFFKDLLSLSEMVMVARRIQIAKKLMNGMGYAEIIEEMKVGKATIAQVDRWLNAGFGGYKEQIKKYNNKVEKIKQNGKKWEDSIDDGPEPFDRLRKKYPAHFLLFNLFKK